VADALERHTDRVRERKAPPPWAHVFWALSVELRPQARPSTSCLRGPLAHSFAADFGQLVLHLTVEHVSRRPCRWGDRM